MAKRSIFISYRRDDTEGQAGRLYEGLAAHFGDDRVFMDVAAIRAGRDFRREIEERVASCAVLLVLIGRQWLEARDTAGQRRLDDPADFVRLETGAALAKPDITVVPVLVGGARMPEAKDLPPDLKDLVFRNAVPLSHQRWDGDLEALVADIEDIMNPAAEPTRGPVARAGKRRRLPGEGAAPWLRWAMLGLGLTVAAALGLFGYNLVETNRRLEDFQRQAQAAAEAASAAEAAAQAARLKEEASRNEAAAAAAAAAVAQRALVEAEEKAAAAAALASAEEKARAEREAAELRAAQEKARLESEAKLAAAEASRLAAEQARQAASVQTQRSEEATKRLQRAAGYTAAPSAAVPAQPGALASPAGPPQAAAPARGQLSIPNWRLRAGCAGTEINMLGTASFRVQPQGSGVVVLARFSGSGDGYSAEFIAEQPFATPQPMYEITALGNFQGPRAFRARWTVRVEASEGLTPVGARGVRFQSDC